MSAPEGRLHPPVPTLVLVMGVAASGKTSLARGLLERLCCVYLDNNFVADPFFAATRREPAYLELRPRLYEILYRIAGENLRAGNSVLLDAPHVKQARSPDWPPVVRRLSADAGARLAVLRCRCSERELRRRMEARDEPRDRWKLDHWREFLEEEPPDVEVPFPHLDLWTEEPLAHNVQRAVAWILG